MAKKKFAGVKLPEEMVIEILLKLPVKSLLICKSVCKPWLYIISNPNFIKSQTHRAISSSQNHPTLVNIVDRPPDDFFYRRYLNPLHYKRQCILVNEALLNTNNGQDLSTSLLHFDLIVMPRLLNFNYAFDITTSYYGIICLPNELEKIVYLWNPSIRKCKKIPIPLHLTYFLRTIITEFAYDSISDDYKVIRIFYETEASVVPIVYLYSANADCWKKFQPLIMKNLEKRLQSSVVVNEVLYFNCGDVLVSFDFHNEVFELFPFPTFIQRKRSDVLDFEGSVAMVFESGSGIDLWTLDDVSGDLSWTKKFSIEYGLAESVDTEIWLSCYLGARQFFGRKSLLNPRHILYNVLYDYEKKEIKYYGLGEKVRGTLKYTETLVSLNGFERVE